MGPTEDQGPECKRLKVRQRGMVGSTHKITTPVVGANHPAYFDDLEDSRARGGTIRIRDNSQQND